MKQLRLKLNKKRKLKQSKPLRKRQIKNLLLKQNPKKKVNQKVNLDPIMNNLALILAVILNLNLTLDLIMNMNMNQDPRKMQNQKNERNLKNI